MSGFFSDEVVKNAAADAPWTRKELDKLLDYYFSGMPPDRIAVELKRNPKAVNRRLEQFTYNERDWATRYSPLQRISRKGKKLTQNENVLIRAHRKRGIPIAATAKLLQRPVPDFHTDTPGRARFQECRQFGPGVDLLLAYRYLYYCKGISVVSDYAYDELEAEEKEFGANSKVLDTVGSDCADDYPPHIRALGMYLAFKYCEPKET